MNWQCPCYFDELTGNPVTPADVVARNLINSGAQCAVVELTGLGCPQQQQKIGHMPGLQQWQQWHHTAGNGCFTVVSRARPSIATPARSPAQCQLTVPLAVVWLWQHVLVAQLQSAHCSKGKALWYPPHCCAKGVPQRGQAGSMHVCNTHYDLSGSSHLSTPVHFNLCQPCIGGICSTEMNFWLNASPGLTDKAVNR